MLDPPSTVRTKPLIGVLSPGFPDGPTAILNGLLEELSARGLEVGTDIEVECRYAQQGYDTLVAAGESLRDVAPDILVGGRSPEARQCMVVAPSKPVLVPATGDPVGFRLAQSLERPGWNLSGAYYMNPELAVARIEAIRAIEPATSAIGLVWDNTEFERAREVQLLRSAAEAQGIKLIERPVRRISEMANVIPDLGSHVPWSMLLGGLSVLLAAEEIALWCAKASVQMLFPQSFFLRYGGKIAFEPDLQSGLAVVADYLIRILGGADVSELPFQLIREAELTTEADFHPDIFSANNWHGSDAVHVSRYRQVG
jgi:putative ABC transport system substrate-binding protein